MIRVLWMFLLVASSVLWARDIDESVIDTKSLRLDDVICKGCEKMREGDAAGSAYVRCKQNNEIVCTAVASPAVEPKPAAKNSPAPPAASMAV